MKRLKGKLKEYKVFWSYESRDGLEEGTAVIQAKSPSEAEEIFYQKNTPHRTPVNPIGYSVDSVE